MNRLKPCPFCGGEAVLTEHSVFLKRYQIICTGYTTCEILPSTDLMEKPEQAIEAWNRRAKDEVSD